MHIAQVAPLTEAIPPKLYGGTERAVSWLTEELIALGHEVTLYASGDSVTSARLEAVWPRALRLDGSVRDPHALHLLMLERVYQSATKFDFIHCHLDYYPFSLFSRQPTPFVTTLHGRLDLPEHQPMFDEFSHVPVVSISNAQRRPLPQARWVRTVHHGLPPQLLGPRPIKPSYFAFLGRIAPEKRVSSPSTLPSIAACRSRSPPRWTKLTRIISNSRSSRCWPAKIANISARSATGTNRNS